MTVFAAPASPAACSQCLVHQQQRVLRRPKLLRDEREASSSLISTVSHEIRSPLTVIRAYSSAALARQPRLTRAEILDFVRLIDDSAKHVELLVSDLQTFSQLESSRLVVRLVQMCLATVLKNALVDLQPLAAGRELEVHLEDPAGEVSADPARLKQVLSNLVENAARYSRPGGSITIRLERSEAAEVVSVEDEGPGVSKEHLDRIFEPFYRVAGRTGAPGTGLGLAICAGLVRAHGGRIWAEPLAGGRFRVSFTVPHSRVAPFRAA